MITHQRRTMAKSIGRIHDRTARLCGELHQAIETAKTQRKDHVPIDTALANGLRELLNQYIERSQANAAKTSHQRTWTDA